MQKTIVVLLLFICIAGKSRASESVTDTVLKADNAHDLNRDSASTFIPVNDPDIDYTGRWDKSNPSLYHSYWGGAYLRLGFTGGTFKIKVDSAVVVRVSIDNAPFIKFNLSAGIRSLTPAPLDKGFHHIVIVANYSTDEIVLSGFELDAGAVTQAPPRKNKLIEFIGDSITSGAQSTATESEKSFVNGYPRFIADKLNCNYTQISFPGITLSKDIVSPKSWAPKLRMEERYFCMKEPNQDLSPWNFTRYTPDIIVINLGTNDKSRATPEEFQKAYFSFLTRIRDKFPDTRIIALRTFGDYLSTETVNAVNERIAAGDSKVSFVDTRDWLKKGSSDFTDNVHPTVEGHVKVANMLAPIIQSYL